MPSPVATGLTVWVQGWEGESEAKSTREIGARRDGEEGALNKDAEGRGGDTERDGEAR
jgi:hypothetical protein